MPTYEYECKNCGHEFTQAMTIKQHDRDNIVCPKCGSDQVKHVIENVFVTTPRKS
ncbi:MAG: FmdB family zinc ribbon protein [Verrucomicrobiota bacterium]